MTEDETKLRERILRWMAEQDALTDARRATVGLGPLAEDPDLPAFKARLNEIRCHPVSEHG